MAEMKGFIFAVTFLIVFTGLIASMPTALFGLGGTAETIEGVDPTLISDFESQVNWTASGLSAGVYTYDLGGYHWYFRNMGTYMYVDRRIYFFGLWFGAVEHTEFVTATGTNRGSQITWAEIESDATDGVIRYNLEFTDSSNEAGGFLFFWNATLYSDPEDAFNNNNMNFIHGIGVTTPNTNVVALLLGLLTFQIPNIPVLPNLIIVTPVAVCVIFLLWFIVKESLPFW